MRIFYHSVLALIGYIFLLFKYRDGEKRKVILKKEYDNSYSIAGGIICGQAVAGILVIAFGGALLLMIIGIIWRYLLRPLF